MRIRLTRLPTDIGRFTRDGINLSHYRVGEVYDVGSTVATYLIVMGVAEPVMHDQERNDRLPTPDTAHTIRTDYRATVLLVDDVLDLLDLYEMALEERYRVLRAS